MKKLLLSLIFVSNLANAEFTQPQKAMLNTAIRAEPSISACVTEGNDSCVADWLNSASTFVVWKTKLSCRYLQENAIVWPSVDSLTVGKSRIYELMCKYDEINPSVLNVRQGLIDAFGAGSATVTAATPLFKRPALQVEKVLATGTGTTGAPGLLTFEGKANINDVSSILRP